MHIGKRELPPPLGVNESTTEDFKISSESSEDWKICKLLGSLLDKEYDIKRRKGQAMNTYRKKLKIYK